MQSTFNIYSPDNDGRMTDKKMAPSKYTEEKTDKSISMPIFELPEERLSEISDDNQDDDKK